MNAATNMHMTIMYLAIHLPDWNSLDSVRRVHSDLEAAALVFFALLVVFDVLSHLSSDNKTKETLLEKIALMCFAVAVLAEIAAYPYGQRNDTLTEQVIGSLDIKARDAFTNASNALTKAGEAETKSEGAVSKADAALDKVDAVNTAASKAFTLAAKANAELADRSLTDKQVKAIVAELNPYSGQEYDVVAYWSSKESVGIAERVNQVLQRAGWKLQEPKEWHGLFGGVVGIQVWIHPDSDKRTKDAAKSLVDALLQESLEAELKLQNPQNNPKHNKISLSVGSKR